MRRTHIADIRLKNNAGLRYPVCRAGADTLDLDAGALPIAASPSEATCQRCRKAYPRRYPWAGKLTREET